MVFAYYLAFFEIEGDDTLSIELRSYYVLDLFNFRKGNTTILSDILNIYLANNDSSFDTDCIHQNLFMSLQKPDKSEDDMALLKAYIEEEFNSDQKFVLSLPPHVSTQKNTSLITNMF